MSALCSKSFSLRVRPNIFKDIVWVSLTFVTGAGSASASGSEGSLDLSVVSVFGGAPSGGEARSTGTLNYNNTGGPESCNCTLATTVLNSVPPAAAGIQHANDVFVITQVLPGPPVTIYNSAAVPFITTVYSVNFTVPSGVSRFTFQIETTCGSMGPNNEPGGSITAHASIVVL